jgi:hypothetical protein
MTTLAVKQRGLCLLLSVGMFTIVCIIQLIWALARFRSLPIVISHVTILVTINAFTICPEVLRQRLAVSVTSNWVGFTWRLSRLLEETSLTTTLKGVHFNYVYLFIYYLYIEARFSVVVKALCYKPEGRGFDTRWGEFLNLPNSSGRTRPWGLLSL